MEQKKSVFDVFGPDFDRFAYPERIKRVSAGRGGEAILIFGSEKTVLLDCGMAYCGYELVKNIKRELKDKTLDYIFLSHSHYDHIGGLPYVRKAYPKAKTCGAEYAKGIFQRKGALKIIKELGETAREAYAPESKVDILTEGLSVDVVVRDKDRISLGKEEMMVLETTGHTDCSLTFVLEPMGLMFASESTGILEGADFVHTPILKNYQESLESAEKCRSYEPKYILLPHLGLLPQKYTAIYWDLFIKSATEKRAFLLQFHNQGLDSDGMLDQYMKRYWDPALSDEQPKEAFKLNAKLIIKAIVKDFEQKQYMKESCQ